MCSIKEYCTCDLHSSQQLIAVDELKNDYRNPVDFCQNLNRASEPAVYRYVVVVRSVLIFFAVGFARIWSSPLPYSDTAVLRLLVYLCFQYPLAGLSC